MDYHAYKSYKRIYYDMREVSDRLCKENGLSVIPPSQNKGMSYKEYTEAKRGTSWKQKLKQTIDRLVITAKDYDDFLRLMLWRTPFSRSICWYCLCWYCQPWSE